MLSPMSKPMVPFYLQVYDSLLQEIKMNNITQVVSSSSEKTQA